MIVVLAFEWMGDPGNVWGSILSFIGAMLAAGGGLGMVLLPSPLVCVCVFVSVWLL